MADALARRTEKPTGGSPVGSMTASDWFGFLEKYVEADARVKKATNARKDLRKKIEEKLGDADLIEAFDRARKNRDVSGEIRTKLDAAYAQFMTWDRKPLNYQAALGLGEDGQPLPMTQADAARVDLEGMEAGKSKHNRGDNPYVPGAEEHQRWDNAWMKGQATIGATLTDDKEKKSATLAVVQGGKGDETAPGDQPPRRRGRPPGGGKKAGAASEAGGQPGHPDEGGGEKVPGDGEGGGDPDPNEGERQPEPQNVGGSDGGPLPADRYGLDWPSSGGNGNGTVN